jgi:hypothetical protein
MILIFHNSGLPGIEKDSGDHPWDPSAAGKYKNEQYRSASTIDHRKRREDDTDYRSENSHFYTDEGIKIKKIFFSWGSLPDLVPDLFIRIHKV